ncbi:hypothetical protein PvtlMGM2_1110, partial [Prevotella sp. MGM2]
VKYVNLKNGWGGGVLRRVQAGGVSR